MRFGRQLRNQTYQPWADKYIEYEKLKRLMKEAGSNAGSEGDDDDNWTEEDEERFVDELVSTQLDKVSGWSSQIGQNLTDRTNRCDEKLEPLGWAFRQEGMEAGKDGPIKDLTPEQKVILEDTLKELDSITQELSELEKYNRINYTGFLKAVKKHDRKWGKSYRVRPLLQVRLSALPFYKEDYTSLLYHLSVLYSFVRQNLGGKGSRGVLSNDEHIGAQSSQSYKFWVHSDNLVEVKTVILRRLPVLIYNPQSSKVLEGPVKDPTLTSVYFDNPQFSLYSSKISHDDSPSSLRLRWYGHLGDQQEIFVEKKTMKDDNTSEETRIPIKEKYVQSFLAGENNMEKVVQKLRQRVGDDSTQAVEFENAVEEIQSFVKENNLQPVVRANYSRTAYEVPGDDRIRISLDTNIAFIREDALDMDRPCRDPNTWHRTDIDDNKMVWPFPQIRKGEIERFPHAVLEIKIKGSKRYEWLDDLMDSHLVTAVPRFSKFVHGVANLFEDNVNTFPFWLSELETDIRRDPQSAYDDAQKRRQKEAETEHAIGSLFAAGHSPIVQRATISPVGSLSLSKSQGFLGKDGPDFSRRSSLAVLTRAAAEAAETENNNAFEPAFAAQPDSEDEDGLPRARDGRAGLIDFFAPAFSTSKYARHRRAERAVALPPGVSQPDVWLKDKGPVQVEAKVWLANQRTFVKWMHIAVLLASLSLGLYNAAGVDNRIARGLAIVYTLLAVFAGVWGWGIYQYRARLIYNRSGKDLDVVWGPMVCCLGLAVALLLNFGLKYRAVVLDKGPHEGNSTVPLYMVVQQP